jgi:DNA-binding transcriptional MerR regulator/DNA gyrase inhibitor GyrI
MELMTIGQVSKGLGVSTRTLRYYEQIGLLPGRRMDGYAYRVYDAQAVARLRQIILLRKLRIPLRQIAAILKTGEAGEAIEAFRQSVAEIDDEITALSTIRKILAALIGRLQQAAGVSIHAGLFDDEAVRALVSSLSPDKIRFKEENNMEELNKADATLSKLKDVRIVYLPPAAVAASHYVGDEPERNASEPLDRFVRESGLTRIKPDLRHYGFNHPNPTETSPDHGYEMWVTVPEDMDVPPPLMKKQFRGGLYAAHMIRMGDFNEWEWLWIWAQNSPDYEPDMLDDGGECMFGLLEEHLNYVNHVRLEDTEPEGMQLDLLLPVREKRKAGGK